MNRSQTSRLDKSVLLSIPFLKKYFRKLTFMLNAQRETKSTRISLANTVHKLWLRFRQANDDLVVSNPLVRVGTPRSSNLETHSSFFLSCYVAQGTILVG
jgi:hypothetical protein